MKRVKGSSTMRRSTAWILSAALVLSACPVTAEAEELTENGSESVSETDQTMDESETAEGEHLNEGENTNASDEEVTKRMQKAEETIQEEKNKSIRSMQSEIQNLVVAAASKVVGDQVSPEHSQKLYDDFIAEMGETK